MVKIRRTEIGDSQIGLMDRNGRILSFLVFDEFLINFAIFLNWFFDKIFEEFLIIASFGIEVPTILFDPSSSAFVSEIEILKFMLIKNLCFGRIPVKH